MSENSVHFSPHARRIVRGDVLRVRAAQGDYLYAVADGGGFGCDPDLRGNAIYVHDATPDLTQALALRDSHDNTPGLDRSARWERYWGVEIADLPPLPPKPEAPER